MAQVERLERMEGETRHAPRSFVPGSAVRQTLIVSITITLFLLVWEIVVSLLDLPSFFLPKPSEIALRYEEIWTNGTLGRHLLVTWSEALAAFALAFFLSSILGYILAKSTLLEKVVSPFLVASQSLPIFAIAPFVLIVLGAGFWSNALMGALVAFFPMLVNMIAALRNIRDQEREVMRSYAASAWHVFAKLELPATLPYLFSSIRVGITLSVIGVLVVELFWGDRGIGFLLNFARGTFDTPLLFAGMFVLIQMNLTMYAVVAVLQRLVIPWRSGAREHA